MARGREGAHSRRIGGDRRGLRVVAAAISGRCRAGRFCPGATVGDLFFWQPRTLGFTRDAADSSQGLSPRPPGVADGRAGAGGRRWPGSTGRPPSDGRAVRRRSAGDRSPRSSASTTSRTGRATNLFPRRPGAARRTAAVTRCATPRRCVPMGARSPRWRAEAAIRSSSVGRPICGVFTMPGGGSVAAISFLGVDLALLLRQTTADGDVVGVFRLDTSSGALTPLVAATPAAEWAGVTGWCELTRPPDVAACLGPSVAPSTSRPARTAAHQRARSTTPRSIPTTPRRARRTCTT